MFIVMGGEKVSLVMHFAFSSGECERTSWEYGFFVGEEPLLLQSVQTHMQRDCSETKQLVVEDLSTLHFTTPAALQPLRPPGSLLFREAVTPDLVKRIVDTFSIVEIVLPTFCTYIAGEALATPFQGQAALSGSFIVNSAGYICSPPHFERSR